MSDSADLKNLCANLAVALEEGREAIEFSPNAALDKLSKWGDLLVQALLAFEGIDEPADGNATTRLNILTNRGLLPTTLMPFFHVLNSLNNTSELPEHTARMQATRSLKIAARLSIWFVKSYGAHLPPSISDTMSSADLLQTIRKFPPTDAQRR